MLRPYPSGPAPRLCQICGLVNRQQALALQQSKQSSKRSFVTLHASRRLARADGSVPTAPRAARLFATSQPCLKAAKRPQPPPAPKNQNAPQSSSQDGEHGTPRPRPSSKPQSPAADLAELVAAVDRVTKAFLAQQGIPSEHTTLTALRACAKPDLRLILDAQKPSQIPASASRLLDLDRRSKSPATDSLGQTDPSPLRPEDVMKRISNAAYAIVSHPAVSITPQVLDEYVQLQARLGRPETFPYVLELYATKPNPRLVAGSIEYVKANPNKIQNAIEQAVAETALNTAIEAKHLDAAVGVVENAYATKAFLRSKIVKKALLPISVAGAVPVAAYILATNLALLQDSLEPALATNMAFVGILAYFGFTGTIGIVALTTANDQMKRVTWAPGTPLVHRWLYEEQRAALDKVACGFGFSQASRYGEEEGEEFMLLREFILRKSMILDAVELMPGMN
ncbi:hypothetical protein B0T26DRAFT_744435 [Lasiosphaeria miniovina]|uniref:Uncharacterized protein n=1 Tax=Lasiosphaeria miniovina TaxID=1954250 RepID=A0AA39ZUA9_9PEZI|nr:uncharacterized protein B0T26DRAFT_744435 [Lasiosphaeria miniovina]KAK0703737.1 hypothetical protein B0T26DRAFT_744435 [Lasiosphaeria miniovina]